FELKPLLSQRQLNRLRDIGKRALPDTAIILRRTLVDDGNGGQESTYASVGTAACRISFAGSKSEPALKDRQQGGRITPQQEWIVTLAHDANVLETDRLQINGETYEIISSMRRRSWEITKRFLVKQT